MSGLHVRGLHNDHLVLAHDICLPQNRAAYEKVFQKDLPVKNRREQIVILDNSVIELGNAVVLDWIKRAAEIVQPNVVVLPDVMLKAEATANMLVNSIDQWTEALAPIIQCDWSFMFVPQGTNIRDFVWCAEHLVHDRRIKWWGVPRNLVKALPQHSRSEATLLLNSLNPRRKIHMLGFSDNMVDDLFTANLKEVHSIDSAVPLRIKYPFQISCEPEPRGDWWELAEFNDIIHHNVRRATDLFGGLGYREVA